MMAGKTVPAVPGHVERGHVTPQHVSADDPHPGGEDLAQPRGREPRAQARAGETAADKKRAEQQREVRAVEQVRRDAGDRDEENDEQRRGDRAVDRSRS